ncbi:MAG: helix-turn-helix transcriptional regulator [Treponema sp.]|nr:helix-turn-helix transcriptional regulator [Treponema sp.]
MANKILEIRRVLSKNLKEQRRKQGFSQEKLAEISGLSVQTVNDIEGGRKWVSDKTITKLSAALDVECYQLLIPDVINQNKKDITSTQKLMALMEKIINGVDKQIEDQFTNFIKKGIRVD